jgi:hypothetical protein
MRIKKNFALRQVAGTWVVLPLSEATIDFTGMLTLNDTGIALWNMLESDTTREDMAKALTEEYDVTYDQALADIDEFVARLDAAGCIEL